MTFMKFVDLDLCCFIPGKVIDEIFRVLRDVRQSPVPQLDKAAPNAAAADLPQLRAFEVLQELRDISSMAMEHFDEKIVPTLRAGQGAASTAVHVLSPFRIRSSPIRQSSGSPASFSYHYSSKLYGSNLLAPSSSPQEEVPFTPTGQRDAVKLANKTIKVLSRKIKKMEEENKKKEEESKKREKERKKVG